MREGVLISEDSMSPAKTLRKTKQPAMTEFVVKIGPPKLTRFEKARIVGARSLQIAMGAPAFVPMEGVAGGPIGVASLELEEDALPISIRRSLPNGTTQDIPIRALSK
jgi:DNA-directed RNA polymerases I, II, and III subunit RPABC2